MKKSILLTLMASAGMTLSGHAAVTASNLLAYYNFDGQTDNQFGSAPGATLNGPAALTAGNMGYSGAAGDESLDLVALNNMASASTAAGTHFDSLTTNNAFSVSFWQYNNAFGNSSAFWLVAPDANGGQRGAQAHTPWGDGRVFFDQSGCCVPSQRITIAAVDNPVVTGQWQHFVFQRDGLGNREIWVDGVLEASAGGGEVVDPFNGVLVIGAEGLTSANSLNGRIDEFAVWDTALDSSEIATLAGGAATDSLIPEPSSTLFGLLGLMALGLRRRR